MATNPTHLYSLDEYFALEHNGEARYEYWYGEIICMSGGSRRHSRISGHIFQLLANHLEQHGTCEAFTSDQAIKTATTLPPYCYPDAVVACGTAAFDQMRGIDLLTKPTLIVEVMSPTSRKRDQKDKLKLYRKISSVAEYLIIDQDKLQIIQHTRQADGNWSMNTFSDPADVVPLLSIGYSLALSDIYAGIEFEQI